MNKKPPTKHSIISDQSVARGEPLDLLFTTMMRKGDYMHHLQSRYGMTYGLRSWDTKPPIASCSGVAFENVYNSGYARLAIEACDLSIQLLKGYYESHPRSATQVAYVVNGPHILPQLVSLLGSDFAGLFSEPPMLTRLSKGLYVLDVKLNRHYESPIKKSVLKKRSIKTSADEVLLDLMRSFGYRPQVNTLIERILVLQNAKLQAVSLAEAVPLQAFLPEQQGKTGPLISFEGQRHRTVKEAALNQLLIKLYELLPDQSANETLVHSLVRLQRWILIMNDRASPGFAYTLANAYLFEESNLILEQLKPYKSVDLEKALFKFLQVRIPCITHLDASAFITQSGMQSLMLAIQVAKALFPKSKVSAIQDGQGVDYTYFELTDMLCYQDSRCDEQRIFILTLNPSIPMASFDFDFAVERIKMYASKKSVALIFNITLEMNDDSSEMHLNAIMLELLHLIEKGHLICFLCKSFQKYITLGSGKVMAGGVFLVEKTCQITESTRNILMPFKVENQFENLVNIQFFTHVISSLLQFEFKLLDQAVQLTQFALKSCCQAAQPTHAPSTKRFPFFMLDYSERLSFLLPFVGVTLEEGYSSDLTTYSLVPAANQKNAFRVNPGQESAAHMVEYFFGLVNLRREPNDNYKDSTAFTQCLAQYQSFHETPVHNEYAANILASIMLAEYGIALFHKHMPGMTLVIEVIEKWILEDFKVVQEESFSLTQETKQRLISIWAAQALLSPNETRAGLLKKHIESISFPLRKVLLLEVLPESYFKLPEDIGQRIITIQQDLRQTKKDRVPRATFQFTKGYDLIKTLIKDFQMKDTLDILQQNLDEDRLALALLMIDLVAPLVKTRLPFHDGLVDMAGINAQVTQQDYKNRLLRILSSIVF